MMSGDNMNDELIEKPVQSEEKTELRKEIDRTKAEEITGLWSIIRVRIEDLGKEYARSSAEHSQTIKDLKTKYTDKKKPVMESYPDFTYTVDRIIEALSKQISSDSGFITEMDNNFGELILACEKLDTDNTRLKNENLRKTKELGALELLLGGDTIPKGYNEKLRMIRTKIEEQSTEKDTSITLKDEEIKQLKAQIVYKDTAFKKVEDRLDGIITKIIDKGFEVKAQKKTVKDGKTEKTEPPRI